MEALRAEPDQQQEQEQEAAQQDLDQHLASLEERSRELQALFFGSDGVVSPPPPMYEPVAIPAARSPQARPRIPPDPVQAAPDQPSLLLRLLQQEQAALPRQPRLVPSPAFSARGIQQVQMSEDQREAARGDVRAFLETHLGPPSASASEGVETPKAGLLAQDLLASFRMQTQVKDEITEASPRQHPSSLLSLLNQPQFAQRPPTQLQPSEMPPEPADGSRLKQLLDLITLK